MYLGVALLGNGSGPYLLGTVENFFERVDVASGEVGYETHESSSDGSRCH